MVKLFFTALFVGASILGTAQQVLLRVDTLTTPLWNAHWFFYSNDTLVLATAAPIYVVERASNRAKKQRYDRLQQKVIKVYPYAHVAGEVMRKYEDRCKYTTDSKEQARLLDEAEEQLKAQFEKDLRSLTISEGVILIKLIDRETGETSFQLVRDLKGRFSAFMYQSVARIFGHNLKDEYDPVGEDLWIENTVAMIEDGTIVVTKKDVRVFE
jgi:hypothetical protein